MWKKNISFKSLLDMTIGNVTTGKGNIKTGPPDCFTYSNYTQYQREILDKKGGERKLSLDMEQYDVIE